MVNYLHVFGVWTGCAAASTALRVSAGWSPWSIGEAAAITVAAAAVTAYLLLSGGQPARRRRESVIVADLLLGWLVIRAAWALATANVVAGVDAALYLPALVMMAVAVRGSARRSVRSR